MPTVNPTGFSAAFDSSNVEMAFARESTWGTIPASVGQGIRLLGESLTETRSRTRPAEINSTGQASAALTTKVEAGGAINIGISPGATAATYGTYDQLFLGMLNAGGSGAGEWSVPVKVVAAGATSLAVTAPGTISASPSGGISLDGAATGYPGITRIAGTWFADNYQVGDWIKCTGFTLTNAATIGTTAAPKYWRIVGMSTDGKKIAIDGPGMSSILAVAADTAGIVESGGSIRNGTNTHSYTFEKKVATGKYLAYPGTYISGGSLSASLGGFVEGSLSLLAKGETTGPTSAAGGAPGGDGSHSVFTADAYTAAPTAKIIDTISGIGMAALGYDNTGSGAWSWADVLTTGSALASVLQGFNVNITKNNARQQFGIGDTNAKGIGKGTFQADGKMQMYFSDFTLYAKYKAEATFVVSFRLMNSAGKGYFITMPGVTLMNPNIVAGGPDTDMVADFTLEANPGFSTPVALVGNLVTTTGAEMSPYTMSMTRF